MAMPLCTTANDQGLSNILQKHSLLIGDFLTAGRTKAARTPAANQ
jgi:hypothetical protein